MKHSPLVVSVALAAASIVAAQSVPPDLSALATKARLDQPVAAWCRGEFRSGYPRAFVVAVTSAAGGGRYVVLELDATVTELASFTRSADLSCYTRAEIQTLNVIIAQSDTIRGQITPRWANHRGLHVRGRHHLCVLAVFSCRWCIRKGRRMGHVMTASQPVQPASGAEAPSLLRGEEMTA